MWGETDEDEEGLYPDESRSIENLRHMRLLALLRDMIDNQGRAKTAKVLEVSYRTVSRAVESGQMTARMSAELERHLLLGAVRLPHTRESIRALQERVGALEEGLGRNLEVLRGVVEKTTAGVREEQALGMRRLERRLAKVEDAGRSGLLVGSEDG